HNMFFFRFFHDFFLPFCIFHIHNFYLFHPYICHQTWHIHLHKNFFDLLLIVKHNLLRYLLFFLLFLSDNALHLLLLSSLLHLSCLLILLLLEFHLFYYPPFFVIMISLYLYMLLQYSSFFLCSLLHLLILLLFHLSLFEYVFL